MSETPEDQYDYAESPRPITVLPRRHREEGEDVSTGGETQISSSLPGDDLPEMESGPDKVLMFGEIQVRYASRHAARAQARCEHKHLVLDREGGLVTCEDCQAQVGPFWALEKLLFDYIREYRHLQSIREQLRMEARKTVRRRATLQVEEAWNSRTMLPSCPFCHRGIAPTDGFGGNAINKADELARRASEAQDKTTTT
jgi:hypothetical protein